MSWCNPNWEAITSILEPSFVVFLYQIFDLELKSLRALYQDLAQGFSQMFQFCCDSGIQGIFLLFRNVFNKEQYNFGLVLGSNTFSDKGV